MAEYIERKAIKYEMWEVGPLCSPMMCVRKATVDRIPAADVVPVVRCGQCIHWKSADDHCTHPAGLCATGKKARNNYCSFGVRKVGEN